MQKGDAPGDIWRLLLAALWFEELLAEVMEAFYSHPLAQQEIGCAAFAAAPGWVHIGLNEREAREPLSSTNESVSTNAEAASSTKSSEALSTKAVEAASSTNQSVSTNAETASSTKAVETASSMKVSIAPPNAQNISTNTPTMRRYAFDEEVDALVIGTGASGSPLGARLAQAGLKVVALEAGPLWNPARDFATDERSQDKLFWNDERLSAGTDPLHFGQNNSGTGVGGSTLHYTAYTPRVQPDDLRLHSEFGVGVDWPLEYQDLEPYYDELERFLGVSGPTPYPWGPSRQSGYALAPLPLNGAAQLMARGCDALGMRHSPAANAALSAPYFQAGVGWRSACTNRGFCQAGCSTGAKASMDVTFVPLALAHGAEIRPNCFVIRIETDKSKRITSVVYVEDGIEKRQRCKHLFLCAGALETPRLLLMNELALDSGQVGRNFMAHPGLQLWGQFDDLVRPYKGIPGSLISEETHRPGGKNWGEADFAGGYLLQSIGVMPVTYASQAARGRGSWGAEMREHMKGYNHTAGINILGDCLPYAHNFMELSNECDARGLPKPRVHFSEGDNEKKMNAHALALMRRIWKEAGARETWSLKRNAHIIGTCRMGHDAASNVVDAFGRSFEVPNLSICDNSVFPSALSVNPALTIMALSLRSADRFLADGRRNT